MKTKIFKSKKQNPYINHTIKGLTLALSLSFFGSSSAWAHPFSQQQCSDARPVTHGLAESLAQAGAGSLPSNWTQLKYQVPVFELTTNTNFGGVAGAFVRPTVALTATSLEDLVANWQSHVNSGGLQYSLVANPTSWSARPDFVPGAIAHEYVHLINAGSPAGSMSWAITFATGMRPNRPGIIPVLLNEPGYLREVHHGSLGFVVADEYAAHRTGGQLGNGVFSQATVNQVNNAFFNGGPVDGDLRFNAARNALHDFMFSPYGNTLLYVDMGLGGRRAAAEQLARNLAEFANGTDMTPAPWFGNAFKQFSKRVGKAFNKVPGLGFVASLGIIAYQVKAEDYVGATQSVGEEVVDVISTPVAAAWATGQVFYGLGELINNSFYNWADACVSLEDEIHKLKKNLGMDSPINADVKAKAQQLANTVPSGSPLHTALLNIANWQGGEFETIPNELFTELANQMYQAYLVELNRSLEPAPVVSVSMPSCPSSNCLGGSKPATTY